MTPEFRQIIGPLLAGALLSGCGVPAKKEDSGTAGAAATAPPPAVISGERPGGALGTKYGRYLDDQDRQNIENATARALASNTTQAYTAPSGTKVTVKPQGPSRYEDALRIQVLVSPRVDTKYPLHADRRTVFAMTDMDLRSAPRLTSNTTRVFRRWERAEVVASVPNSPYRLISINGVAVGYAREVYLAARKEDVPPPRYPAARSAAGKQVKSNPPSARGARRVTLKSECKLVKRTIQFHTGATDTETVKFCKEPPSTWRRMS